ncbi:MAG: exodeoxyribonuclease VII large subunit [Bacteroidaceae bacterium]|nr:exodeoxyribonuclease VII large subunit [Bacteroidaceae bacterium]
MISETTQALTLLELNSLVKDTLELGMPEAYWVQAELSEARINNGHCYVEFVEKDRRGNGLVAKARGIIWRNVFSILKPTFERATGQLFTAGIKVLVQVNVVFHELYGYSLNVTDIDPSYTMGDMARKRQEILRQLQADGVLELNKELAMPLLPKRIAVISSATAAGYGDFSNQLTNNAGGFYFHAELFAAIMQGDGVEQSILQALDRIYAREHEFDVVVIIRGGGATSDLTGFDTYPLAAAVAQFPLPVITGIGHERDDTVLDMVSHTRVKTPTAAAEYLIGKMQDVADALADLSQRLYQGATYLLTSNRERLLRLQTRIPTRAMQRITGHKLYLMNARFNISKVAMMQVASKKQQLPLIRQQVNQSSKQFIEKKRHQLILIQQKVTDATPEKLLARGYSITLKDGKIVKDASLLKPGDELVTKLKQGETISIVK